MSCHSWDSAPTAPSCSQTPPATAAAGLLPHLPAQPGQGLCMSGMRDLPSLRGSKHCLLFPHRSKDQAGLLTLLHSIKVTPGLLSLRGGMGPW